MLLALSIAMAALSHRFVEKPFRGGPATRRSRVFATAGVAMIALLCVSVLGVRQQGFESRVSAEVLALDRQRRPEIPFQHCDGKLDGCPIGSEDHASSGRRIVFWGDSHMLAWAPAIDKVLKDHGVAATLVMTSACPPLVGVANDMFPACEKQNARLVASLDGVDAVVMSAAWNRYQDAFNDGRVRAGDDTTGIITRVLPRTIKALSEKGIDAYLIGPVPTYQDSIPRLMAHDAMNGGRGVTGKSVDDHYLANHEFYSVASDIGALVPLIDPAEWMCTPHCAVGQGSEVFYRDEGHLSIAGAVRLSDQLADALAALLASERIAGEPP